MKRDFLREMFDDEAAKELYLGVQARNGSILRHVTQSPSSFP
jgi:hypothetical protein